VKSLIKIQTNLAKDICQYFNLSDESKKLLTENMEPTDFIKQFMEKQFYLDVIKFIAHALPKRESVWWACLAAKYQFESIKEDKEDYLLAMDAAELWVRKPTEQNRRSAEELSIKTEYKHAASWAAMAAFWSTGSVTKPGDPEVPPQPYLFAHAVAGAVSLAGALTNPEKPEDGFKQLIAQGLDLAYGGNGELKT